MVQGAKVLPCGHIFHLACLRAWLQQSGSDNFSCPLCRLPLFRHQRGPGTPSGASSPHSAPTIVAGQESWQLGGASPLYSQMVCEVHLPSSISFLEVL